jgi:hypothetical protein
MVVSKSISSGVSVEVHALLADWGEGSSNSGGTATGGGGNGAPAAVGDATWLHRFFPSVLWSSTGGDFAVGTSATQSVGSDGAYSWQSPQLASDVQNWVNHPAMNFGWILIAVESNAQTAKRFNSRENADAATQPQLIVNFTSAQQVPATPRCHDALLFLFLAIVGTVGCTVERLRKRRQVVANAGGFRR